MQIRIKISELNIVGIGLRDLSEISTTSKIKFKIARNLKVVDDILNDVLASTENNQPDDELLNTEVDIEIIPFNEDELSQLETKAKTIFMILPIVKD